MFNIINLENVKTFVIQNFNKLFNLEEKVFNSFLNEFNKVTANNCKQIINPNNTTISFFIYRLCKEINKVENIDINIYNKMVEPFNVYISLSAFVGENFNIYSAKNVYIGNNVIIGNNCKISSNVKIGSTNTAPKINNNVTILDGVNIYGNIEIGDNCKILNNCYVTENIEANCEVGIINQLQMVTKSTKNYLPSQTLIVYGVVPKFKNTIHILGDGFYNPIVNFKNCNKELDYTLSYWDKNKIIIKFKNTKPVHDKNVIITLLCNRTKINILSSAGLTRALENLQP